MSDPVKNAEVEDVLSSIRRLVSEDKRPLQAAKPAPMNDRLVLTPALRVQESVAVQFEDAPEVDAAEDAVRITLLEEEQFVDAAFERTSLNDEVDELSEDYQDDPYNFDDEANSEADDETDDDAGAPLLLKDAEAVTPTPDDDEVVTISDRAAPDTKTATLSAKIAALETAIGDISDEWEPDAAGQDAYAGSEPEAMVWEDDEADEQDVLDVSFRHHDDVDASDVDASEVEEVKDPAFGFASFDEIKSDDAQAETTDNVVDADDDVAGDNVADDDVAGFAFAAEDQLLDEETLRELVSEIVQSELQGALGERITRNVRRLVRREIHRAMTARDLD